MTQGRSEPLLSSHLHSIGNRLGLPIGGNFELTARCNFNCPMCYVHLSSEDIQARGKELSAAQWISIAEQAKNAGMMFALLTGGEPFVRKDFFEIYDAMKAMGLMISINSNGSMLEGEIREKLIANPPFRINISLYGGSDETYRGMCGQSAYHRVKENIRALKEAGVDVRLNVSITPYNRQDLEAICAAARELNVQMKASAYMYPPIRVHGDCGHRLSAEEAAACAVQWDMQRFTPEEFAQRAQNMHDMTLKLEGECSADLDEGVRCRAGRSSFWMTWDGRMLPCGMLPGPEAYPLEVGFDEAWRQIREETKIIRMPAKCGTCPRRDMCSVCAAVCVTETGAFDKVPEYVCRMTYATAEKTWEAYQKQGGTV